MADSLELGDLLRRQPTEALLEQFGLAAGVVPGGRARIYDQSPERRLVHPRAIVALMNIVAEMGTSRLESKVQKGESIPEDHLRAFRVGKEEVLCSWLKHAQQIVLRHFVAVGKPVDQGRLFQYRFSEALWQQLRAYVRNLAGLPLWANRAPSATVFGGKQTGDFWRTIWETGRSPQGPSCSPRRSTSRP